MALQGTGTELDPFLVTSLAELRTELTDASAYYKVTRDLDTIGTEWENDWGMVTASFKELDFDKHFVRNVKTSNNFLKFNFSSTSEVKKLNLENLLCRGCSIFGTVNQLTTFTSISISTIFEGTIQCLFCASNTNYTINDMSLNMQNNGTIGTIFRSNQTIENVSVNLSGSGIFNNYNATICETTVVKNFYVIGEINVTSSVGYVSLFNANIYSSYACLDVFIDNASPLAFYFCLTTPSTVCFFAGDVTGNFSGTRNSDGATFKTIAKNQAVSGDYLNSIGFVVIKKEGA